MTKAEIDALAAKLADAAPCAQHGREELDVCPNCEVVQCLGKVYWWDLKHSTEQNYDHAAAPCGCDDD